MYSDTQNAMNPDRLDGFVSCLETPPAAVAKSALFTRLTEEVVPALDQAVVDVITTLELKAFFGPSMLCPSR